MLSSSSLGLRPNGQPHRKAKAVPPALSRKRGCKVQVRTSAQEAVNSRTHGQPYDKEEATATLTWQTREVTGTSK